LIDADAHPRFNALRDSINAALYRVEMGLTTSAISYTIKRMEAGLDVVLFTRNTRSIELTEYIAVD
jgi:DNA-binding transcriptional LysR family regulator